MGTHFVIFTSGRGNKPLEIQTLEEKLNNVTLSLAKVERDLVKERNTSRLSKVEVCSLTEQLRKEKEEERTRMCL